MPSRRSTNKVITSDLQGDDSFVVYRPMTVNEVRELQKTAGEYQKVITKRTTEYAESVNKSVDELTQEETELALNDLNNADDILYFMDKTFSKYVIDWNWVDFDDNPLPKPKDDWEVMGQLTIQEYQFIQSLFSVNQDETEAKN